MTDTKAVAENRWTPILALGGYVALGIAGLASVWVSWADLQARQDDVARAEEQLDRLRGRAADHGAGVDNWGVEPGAAFIGGEKDTIAMAEFQRRVEASAAKAGGTVISRQVERADTETKNPDIELTIECDFDQPGLQRFLYDIESSTPFIFVDKLDLRTRNESDGRARAEPRLRVSARLSSYWRKSGT